MVQYRIKLKFMNFDSPPELVVGLLQRLRVRDIFQFAWYTAVMRKRCRQLEKGEERQDGCLDYVEF